MSSRRRRGHRRMPYWGGALGRAGENCSDPGAMTSLIAPLWLGRMAWSLRVQHRKERRVRASGWMHIVAGEFGERERSSGLLRTSWRPGRVAGGMILAAAELVVETCGLAEREVAAVELPGCCMFAVMRLKKSRQVWC